MDQEYSILIRFRRSAGRLRRSASGQLQPLSNPRSKLACTGGYTSLAAKSSGCPPHRAETRCFALLATQYDYRSLCVRGDDFEWSVIGPGVSERMIVGLRYNKLLITLMGKNGECMVR